ncbi:hypothetical protein AVEN_213224-1 [Araneus ventricosus]|uniref:Uncharacterized protein n=1 Tax=Araneus ventricosus TaxID=182803 RepID=A0A4Y2JRG2_ARAVE|nr:hypothetical protein AVEN_213224-1 [Araneus ventricosus]
MPGGSSGESGFEPAALRSQGRDLATRPPPHTAKKACLKGFGNLVVGKGWFASTYQCNSEPRDYQECSQVHEPRVRGCRFLGVAYRSPTSVGTFNPLITQLSSVFRSLKPRSRRLIRFSPPFSPRTFRFYSPLQGVDEVVKLHLPFPTLENGTLVDHQLTFLVVNPDYGKVLEFSPPPAYSGMTPKGTANVFADSDGFLGIVAALCVKSFLCARLVSDVQVQLSCCLPPISKGEALFFSWERCSREGNLTV